MRLRGDEASRTEVRRYSAKVYAGVLVAAFAGMAEARSLGARGYGVIAVVVATYPFGVILLGLGVPVSLLRSVAQDPGKAVVALGIARRLAARGLVVALPASAAASWWLFRGYPVSTRAIASIAITSSALGVFAEVGVQTLISTNQLRQLGTIRYAPIAAVGGSVISAWIMGVLSLNLAIGLVILKPLVETILVLRYIGRPQRSENRLRPHMWYGRRALVGQLGELGSARVDQLMLIPLIGSQALGRYAVAVTISTLPLTVVHARLAQRYAPLARTSDQALGPILRWLLSNVFLTVALGLPISLLAGRLLPVLYGPDFAGLLPTLLVLVIATALVTCAYSLGTVLSALGRPVYSSIGWLLGLVATIVLMPFMARGSGILGVSWLSCASYAITMLVMIGGVTWLVRRSDAQGLDPLPSVSLES